MAVPNPGLAARSAALNRKYGLGKKPKRTPLPPPPGKTKTTKTPVAKVPVDPDLAKAQQVADASIAPSRTDIQKAIADAEAQRTSGLAASSKLIEALGHLTSGDAEQARAAYDQAGQTLAGIGKGLTGALGSDLSNAVAAANARISGMGAPSAVADHSGDIANVDYYTGAYLPSRDLASDAPRALAQVLAQRLASGGRLADQATADAYKTTAGIGDLRQKLVELEAKRPGLIQDALDTLAQRRNQERATLVQIGSLQLQQSKSLADQAVAYTNLTGTVHVVVGKGAKAHVVDTGKPAVGSDAAQITAQQQAAQARVDASVKNAQLAADTRKQVADIAAQATRDAANARAAATKAAAQIRAQAKQGKPATPAQKATIINGAQKSGIAILQSRLAQFYNNTPELAPQQKGEKIEDYNARHARGIQIYNHKKTWNWDKLWTAIVLNVGPQLKVLGYTPAQVHAFARAILLTQITPPKGR